MQEFRAANISQISVMCNLSPIYNDLYTKGKITNDSVRDLVEMWKSIIRSKHDPTVRSKQ